MFGKGHNVSMNHRNASGEFCLKKQPDHGSPWKGLPRTQTVPSGETLPGISNVSSKLAHPTVLVVHFSPAV